MKIFISWSGEQSRALARAVTDWLQNPLQYAQPWMSDDIHAGDRWSETVGKQLDACDFGIICTTPANLASQWLMFEAGALSKKMGKSRVVPLLYGLEFSDITGPLSQFQCKKAERAGILDIVKSINLSSGEAVGQTLPEDRLTVAFDQWYPQLEAKIKKLPPDVARVAPTRRSTEAILEDVLAGMQALNDRFDGLAARAQKPQPQPQTIALGAAGPRVIYASNPPGSNFDSHYILTGGPGVEASGSPAFLTTLASLGVPTTFGGAGSTTAPGPQRDYNALAFLTDEEKAVMTYLQKRGHNVDSHIKLSGSMNIALQKVSEIRASALRKIKEHGGETGGADT